LKTVVHVLPYMAKGGTEKHVLTLIRGLRFRYNLILLAPYGEIVEEFFKLGITFREFPEIKGNFFKKINIYKRTLIEINKKYSVDIIHIHAAHEFLIFSKKALPSVPVIFHLSAHQGSFFSRFINYTLSALISRKKADLVIAVSEEEKKIVNEKGLPESKIRVIYNGYDGSEGDDFDTINNIKKQYELERCMIIGNLGRLHRTKRLDILIKAFARVKKKVNNNIKLLLIGDGPEKNRLERISHRCNVENDVIFTGFIKRGDLILKIMDIFVLPTSFEGCSNVLVEAMAKGLPIITTDIPSVKWMFEDAESVLLFEKNSVIDLENKIIKLIKNKALRDKISRGALMRFHDKFRAKVMVDKVNSLYTEILT